MKRWIGSLVLATCAGLAIAQAPFTIVRPAEGSKVRENVRVLIPKKSIPQGGYIGVFLDGKFVEATLPPLEKDYYVYTLDTKGRKLPDGPKNLELVLYVDYNENPRIVDKSSVNINIANKSSISVPAGGIKLRYTFQAGTQLVYMLQTKQSISTLSSVQNTNGGIAAEFTSDGEKIRLLYAFDNAYSNGDGLVRMQALPQKGKDYAFLTTQGNTEAHKYMDYDMHPVYMRINSTGGQVFGSIPEYEPISGARPASGTDLFAPYPLPTLPIKAIKPGDSWPSRFQSGSIDMEKQFQNDSVIAKVPARGEFVGVEWEMGHPCARITNTITQGTRTLGGQALKDSGREFSDPKLTLEETIWFALDTHRVIKIVRDQTLEGKLATNEGTGGNGRSASGGGITPGVAPGGRTAGGGRGGPGASGRAPAGGGLGEPGPTGGGSSGSLLGQGLAPAVAPGQGAGGRTNAMGGNNGGFGGQGGRGSGAGGAQFIRIRSQQIFTLEQ